MNDPWTKLISSFSAPTGASRRMSGAKVDPGYVIEGLTRRGLPRHVAEGFAMNFADESGFDPGINERNPIVKGSRGGYGLYQLTGPRRRAYERFAAQRGVDLADPDAQMDFLMYELGGPERSAASAIMNTSSAGEAGAAIVNRFLRPAEEHRRSRTARYLSGSGEYVEPRVAGHSWARSRRTEPNRLWLAGPAGGGSAPTANRLWLGLGGV